MNEDKGVKDLYDSERKALRDIAYALRVKHSFRGVKTLDQEDAIRRAFEHEARNRCAEIGLKISVQWDPEVSDNPSDNNLYWNPRLIVDGRTDKIPEFDHERQTFEITRGVGLEEPGFIRQDGTIREDPKKRNIY